MTKLYAFQPKGHGALSFFTIAENEEQARAAVSKYIEDNQYKYAAKGWGSTDYYTMTVAEQGEVVENDNG